MNRSRYGRGEKCGLAEGFERIASVGYTYIRGIMVAESTEELEECAYDFVKGLDETRSNGRCKGRAVG